MRTIKTLGIATAVVLALVAVAGAASASASAFENITSTTATKVTGTRSGANHELKLGGETFKCANVSFSGELKAQLESGELTVSPELGGCSWQPPSSWSWKTNGCKFRLRPGLASGEQSTSGWLDIVGCEKPMSITSSPSCEVTIGNQTGLGPVRYENTGTGNARSIQVIANLSNIEYTRSAYGCPSSNGSSGPFTDGTYSGEWTAKGSTTDGLVQKPIGVKPTSYAYQFLADEAPATIAGKGIGVENKPIFAITNNGNVNCKDHLLSGSAASTAPKTITLTGTYGNCTFLGMPSTMSMGKCSYVLGASGGFEIAGAECATNPITISITGGNCTATIGPQAGSSGLAYANSGSGKLRSVTTGGEAKNLKVTVTGNWCLTQGTYSTTVYKGIDSLTATNSLGKQQGLSVE